MMKTPLTHYSKGGWGRWFSISPFIPQSFTGLRCLFNVLLILAPLNIAIAEPFVPTSRTHVITTLPSFMVTLQRTQKHERQDTAQLSERIQQAQTYLDSAQKNNDPRWMGYAQAALNPWWNISEQYPKVALLKATILQNRHQFPSALVELNSVLNQQPRNTQALLTRAHVYMMQTDYTSAQQDCQRILWLSQPTLGVNCLAQVNGLTGKGLLAIQQLTQLLADNLTLSSTEREEIHITIATIAHRHQQKDVALQNYQKAYAINPNNGYLIEQFTDYLIENNLSEMLITLFSHIGIDNLKKNLHQQIKMAQYYQLVGDTQLSTFKSELDDSFTSSKIRKELFPHKEYALFSLSILNKYNQALHSALKNWKIQQAPSDAILVLRAAIASQQLQQAQSVIQWVKDTRLYDHRIDSLINTIETSRIQT
ncbi:hypothetical protein A9Q99_15360 [Gammaproteobacteria bacterium 45_16_T64]|nr:hypothetical protein A9Q99_15360 [Gammaproteobacteria bacterium 45_16_T64]